MSRRQVAYNTRGEPVVFRNVRRNRYSEPLIIASNDEVVTLELDLTEHLEIGETVTAVAVTPTRMTVASSLATPVVTLTLSAVEAGAYADFLITFSTGDKLSGRIHGNDSTTQRDYGRKVN